jgi:DNA-binding transcriptional MerR regulator
MRIGELAGLVGISTRAIRHYHRVGLLPEPARKPNGYREYSLRDAVGLARVRRLTELGLSLDEAGDVLTRTLNADPGAAERAYAVYACLDELAGLPADDPRVEATAQAIVAAIPEPARQAIRFPDGDLEETGGGFVAAFYADFAPAQAAAIRRAVDLMKEATS